ncbi:MAG: hypothetical protein AABW58_03750 [Nanoarchaeota archaeon]
MKKLFSLILILLLVASFVDATRFVRYDLREGKIDAQGDFKATGTPVNDVNVVGYVCLDEGCKTLGKKIFIKKNTPPKEGPFEVGTNNGVLNSGDNYWIELFYPTELMSQFGYAVYYYKNGFIPWEANPNWFGTNSQDPQGPFNVYLSKKEVCSSEITNVKVMNNERKNTPVVIYVDAELDAKTKAAINHAGPLEAVPEDLKEEYSVRTLVNLDIIDEDGFNVYSDSQEALIGYGNEENIEFEFTPGSSGSFTALVTSKVTDEKCLESEVDHEEKEFVVLDENPLNMCYTELNNLELSSYNVKAGHDLLLEFNKISNFQENIENEVIVPVETWVNVELYNSDWERVHEKLFNLKANLNSVDPEEHELLINIPEFLDEGLYNIVVRGYGKDERCSLDNKEDTLHEEVFVENGGFFGNAPKIITNPVTKAELGKTYLYDVDAVDLDNDVLAYYLVGPEGMTINENTGLVTLFVDPEKFSANEKVLIVLFVTDGLFVDAQVFFIEILDEVKEKKEKKDHEFKVNGLDLEFSDNENGVVGFLSLKNDGDFRENNVNIYADIYDLGVHEVLTSNVNLGTRDSIWVPVDIRVPSNTQEGEYIVNVVIENSKHKQEHRFVAFIEDKNKENVRVITRA